MPMRFEDYKQYLSPALAKSTDLVIDHGEGSYMWDVNGEKYLDFVSGIAVNALGHGNKAVQDAIKEQVDKLINGSFNMVNFPSTLRLAERIAEVAPGELGCTLFANGGAEATDASLKLVRAYTKRPCIIAFTGSFHGRTMGAMSVTGSNSKYRHTYQPCVPGIYFAPYPQKDLCPAGFDAEQRSAYCLGEIDKLFSYLVAPDEVAGIIMEPVQGEGGYFVPPQSFVEGVRERCDKYGILLIFDEIQSGWGRTRDSVRLGPHGQNVRERELRRRARRHELRQGHRWRHAHERHHLHRGDHEQVAARHARRHLRRQPGVRRRGQRGAR